MSLSLSEILSLPPEQRKRRRSPKRGESKKRRRKYEMGRKFTEEDIIKYLVDNDIRSASQLDRERGSYEPSVYDCRKVFGSWQNAKEAAFGGEIIADAPNDAEYILKSIVEFNVWSYRKYMRVRKLRPDIFPSYHQVLNQWGNFSTLIYYAKRYSTKECLESYLRLWRILGKKPTLEDCRRKNISLESAIDIWGDKRSLDDFLSGIMRSQNEK
jgi:hypothetical protein